VLLEQRVGLEQRVELACVVLPGLLEPPALEGPQAQQAELVQPEHAEQLGPLALAALQASLPQLRLQAVRLRPLERLRVRLAPRIR